MFIKESMSAELTKLGEKNLLGIDEKVAPNFNRWCKKTHPKLHNEAKKLLDGVKKTSICKGRSCWYTYIQLPKNSKYENLKFDEPYPKSPTKSQLLADISWMLACKYGQDFI